MKVRVRHEPTYHKYVIETKRGLFGGWEYVNCSYYTFTDTPNAVFPDMETAKERAIKAAEYMLDNPVVWEGECK